MLDSILQNGENPCGTSNGGQAATFVFGPRAEANAFGDCGDIQCLEEHAEIVAATLVFRANA